VNSSSISIPYNPHTTEFPSGKSHFIIRAAQKEDLHDLANIIADSFHSHKGLLSWFHSLSRIGIYEDLRNRLYSSGSHYVCFVAMALSSVAGCLERAHASSDLLLGTVEMTLRDPYPLDLERSRYPYLSNLAVRDEYRGQGIAQQLLTACEQTAITWGFEDLYLHVLENNQRAKRVYFKLGYQLCQFDPGWGFYLLGRPRRMLLHKTLSVMQ